MVTSLQRAQYAKMETRVQGRNLTNDAFTAWSKWTSWEFMMLVCHENGILPLWSSSQELIIPVKMWKKHQKANGKRVCKILPRSSKTRKNRRNFIAKRSLGRHRSVSVQLLSHVQLFATPWTAACWPPCPSPSPRVYSNSCPLSWWSHPTISSFVVSFSSCLQSFPASGSFPNSQPFTSSGQSIGASASASFLPMNIKGCFPLGLTGWISLQSRGLSRVFSNITVWKHWFFSAQPSLWSNSHIWTWLLEKP